MQPGIARGLEAVALNSSPEDGRGAGKDGDEQLLVRSAENTPVQTQARTHAGSAAQRMCCRVLHGM